MLQHNTVVYLLKLVFKIYIIIDKKNITITAFKLKNNDLCETSCYGIKYNKYKVFI